MNSTRTCVTPPLEPVRPRTLVTLASLTGATFILTTGHDRVGNVSWLLVFDDRRW